MSSPVAWGADGAPRSIRFDDVYRSLEAGGLDQGLLQAREVFLKGCGLWSCDAAARAWQGHRHWHVLETGFGLGLSFLATWHAWRQDPHRPQRLFFSSIEAWPVQAADIERSARPWPELHALADALARAWRGLLPGVHRLVFEHGQVQLTLCIGPVEPMLREIDVAADSVFLDGFSPSVNPEMWSQPMLQALARRCRPGTRVASWCVRRSVREALQACGFQVTRAEGLPPKAHRLEAVFSPAWNPCSRLRQAPELSERDGDSTDSAVSLSAAATRCLDRTVLVLGAGLSGSAVACSLARRGWSVTVLDAASGMGAGASGLPAGLAAPHVSADDNVLSRITRAGVRATLQRCGELLETDVDWACSGVLEHRVEGKRALPAGQAWPPQGHEWSTPADPGLTAQAGLPAQAQALWHGMAAWLRPSRLVAAQLATPGITVCWNQHAQVLRRQSGHWQVLDAQGAVLAEADHLVLAGGYDTGALLPRDALPIHPLRGQVSMGPLGSLPPGLLSALPPFPVNGHGSFITGVPLPSGDGPGWYLGSTFERGCAQALLREEDHQANLERLDVLLPTLSAPMHAALNSVPLLAWAGVRCTLPDRLPAVGAIDPQAHPGLMVCTGMGARGISLSVLCGELLAAHLETEPLPLAPSLSTHLWAGRFGQAKQKA